jgi:hypothetical protein
LLVASVQYELRFVTVPDPNANGFTLGQRKEREVVVADREANIRSVTNAFQASSMWAHLVSQTCLPAQTLLCLVG